MARRKGMIRKDGWYWFLSGKEEKLKTETCGKWMYFFEDQEFAQDICQKAIDAGVCYECKCTDMEMRADSTGVICFYLNGDDLENHKRVIRFMLANNLVRKTKSGKYYNISFKFDNQTRAGEYGADFEGKIKLEEIVDLKTGEFVV